MTTPTLSPSFVAMSPGAVRTYCYTASRDREFVERIIPSVRAMSRLRRRGPCPVRRRIRSYATIVFDGRDGAEAFMGNVTRDFSGAIASGVHLHSIEILEVIGS